MLNYMPSTTVLYCAHYDHVCRMLLLTFYWNFAPGTVTTSNMVVDTTQSTVFDLKADSLLKSRDVDTNCSNYCD